MKLLSRDFTLREKVMILILSLILLGLLYYQFVDKNIREEIRSAENRKSDLELEYSALYGRLEVVKKRHDEVETILSSGKVSILGSYNSSKEEVAFLNDILEKAEIYNITFGNVTREGDLIRRPFTLTYMAADYKTAEGIYIDLNSCKYRCLINDVKMAAGSEGDLNTCPVSVSINAVFYETMVGGTPDAGLPPEETESE